MKNFILFVLSGTIILAGCDSRPQANFTVSSQVVDVYEDVQFTNTSHRADYYEWDFGDGHVSNEVNPIHFYRSHGVYTVSLTAFRDGHPADEAYMDIEVLFPTTLEITVLEYWDEYPVPEASVRLYPTLTDWDNETNLVIEANTDANGVVVFQGLNPLPYYIDVYHASHNNYALRDEDIKFIKTDPLIPNELNSFTAYVDYYLEPAGINREESKKESKSIINSQQRTLKEKQAEQNK